VGTPIVNSDIPSLEGKFVHFASPKFTRDQPCINGKVTHVDASNNPKVIYVRPHGVGYSIRVDINCYNIVEKVEADEFHKSH
jgi:hypothetical protein